MSFDPSTIEVEDFLECLDIRNISEATTEEIRFSCPFPNHENGDENASAYMNAETTAFFCHGCKRRGNAVSFTAELLEITPLEAIRMLRERYMPGYLNPDAVDMVEEVRKILNKPPDIEVKQPVLPETAIDRFAVDWERSWHEVGQGCCPPTDYMFERGFKWQTLEKWEFGYDKIYDRITFAVRDEDGTLIGFKARAYDDRHPKYLVLGDRPGKPERYGWPCYHTGHVLFGAHRVPKQCDDLVICEGELNVVALDQKVGVPAVAINGSNFTEQHARIIRRVADGVTIFMDSDHAGNEASKRIQDQLWPHMRVRIVPSHEGDPADMTADEIANCLQEAQSWLSLALRKA